MSGLSSSNELLLLTKKDLIKREIGNVQMRCDVVNKGVNKTINEVFDDIDVGEAYPPIKPFSVSISVNEYTEHITEWKGLSVSNKARRIPTNAKDYWKSAMNWVNGRRSLILATKVFPQFIVQSVQYCLEVATTLFSPDKGRIDRFFRLCVAAVISCILKSNVQLNQRSAETPLICQNSITKHGLDKLLKNYLPKTFLSAIPNEVSDNEENNQRSNVFSAFQKAFTDLYNSYLMAYRQRYTSSRINQLLQFPQSAILSFSNLSEHINQNIHLCSREELNFLQKELYKIQRITHSELARRFCYDNANVNSQEHCTNTKMPSNEQNNEEEKRESYFRSLIETHNVVTTDRSCFASTVSTSNTVSNVTNFVSMDNRQMPVHCLPPSSMPSTNQCEISQSRLPQKRKMPVDHYENNDFMPSSKRARCDNNDHTDMLNSFFGTFLEGNRPWTQMEQNPTNFTNETPFKNQ